MTTSKNFPQQIEEVQIKNAAVKHTAQFLRANPELGTLDLCSLSLSGSYISNPVSYLHLDSALRLSYPKKCGREDTIKIRIKKNNEIFSFDSPVSILHTPERLIYGLSGTGITFSASIKPKELGKLLVDYLAKNLEFANAAALPGWEYHPTQHDDLSFLLPHTVSSRYIMEPLRSLKVNYNPALTESEALKILEEHYSNPQPERDFLVLLKTSALLQTLFNNCNVPDMPMLNFILENNNREYQKTIVDFLSLYKSTKVHTLPMPETELKKLLRTTKDDFMFFCVPQYRLPQYQNVLLHSNLFFLQQIQESDIIPVVFSSGFLSGINDDDILVMPLTDRFFKILQPQTFTALNSFNLFFLQFMEKNLDIFPKKLEAQKINLSENGIMQLLTVQRLIESFLHAHAHYNLMTLHTYFGQNSFRLKNLFNHLSNSDVSLGLSEQFLQILREEIANKTIEMHSNTQSWCPETMETTSILFDKFYAYLPQKLFDNMVQKYFCQIQGLTILKALHSDGYLIADDSGRRHYKKKGRYVDTKKRSQYQRFITLKLDSLNPPNGPKFF